MNKKERAWAIVWYPPNNPAPEEPCHIDGWYYLRELAEGALCYWQKQYPAWEVALVELSTGKKERT